MKTDPAMIILSIPIYLVSPFLLIWSLNALFSLNIPLSFKTWAAGLVLMLVLKFYFGPRSAREPLPADDRDEDDEAGVQVEEMPDSEKFEPGRTLIIDGFQPLRKTKIPRYRVKK